MKMFKNKQILGFFLSPGQRKIIDAILDMGHLCRMYGCKKVLASSRYFFSLRSSDRSTLSESLEINPNQVKFGSSRVFDSYNYHDVAPNVVLVNPNDSLHIRAS